MFVVFIFFVIGVQYGSTNTNKKHTKTEEINEHTPTINEIKNECSIVNKLIHKHVTKISNIVSKLNEIKNDVISTDDRTTIFRNISDSHKCLYSMDIYIQNILDVILTKPMVSKNGKQITNLDTFDADKVNTILNTLTTDSDKSPSKKHGNLMRINSEINWTNDDINHETNDMKQELKSQIKQLYNYKSNKINALMANMDFMDNIDSDNEPETTNNSPKSSKKIKSTVN